MRTSRALLILIGIVSAAQCAAPDAEQNPFVGSWSGTMSSPAGDLEMRVDLALDNGEWSAQMFSVTQGNAQIPVESVTVEGAAISLAMPVIGGSYEGVLADDGQRIEGTFAQMGTELALALERMSDEEADEAAAGRPQDPTEPYPYLAEEVSYPNPDGGHTLAGTFTRPEEGGPFPAVVLISGSGPQDRDEALMGHRPFLVLSDHLTRRGIAVLRFDDRGVGESTGDHGAATSVDFASDALAGVAYLKGRDDVDPEAIGLAGHSEGGLIAPIAAVGSDDVAFIVLMAGPGVTGERILYAQSELISRAAGATDEQIENNQALQRTMFDILKSEPDIDRAEQLLTDAVRAAFDEMSEADRAQAGVTDEATLEQVVSQQVTSFNTVWFRYFLTYDPAPVIEQVAVPVLAINGEKDLQVPYEENLREIEAALVRGGNANYEVRALPDLNHLFQHSETGSPTEYATIDETWSVESMELIADWVLGVTGG